MRFIVATSLVAALASPTGTVLASSLDGGDMMVSLVYVSLTLVLVQSHPYIHAYSHTASLL